MFYIYRYCLFPRQGKDFGRETRAGRGGARVLADWFFSHVDVMDFNRTHTRTSRQLPRRRRRQRHYDSNDVHSTRLFSPWRLPFRKSASLLNVALIVLDPVMLDVYSCHKSMRYCGPLCMVALHPEKKEGRLFQAIKCIIQSRKLVLSLNQSNERWILCAYLCYVEWDTHHCCAILQSVSSNSSVESR